MGIILKIIIYINNKDIIGKIKKYFIRTLIKRYFYN